MVELGFLWSVSYIKPIPTPEKILAVGKKWPKCHFRPLFAWVRLAGGFGIRRFHRNIYMFSNPTDFGIIAKHPERML